MTNILTRRAAVIAGTIGAALALGNRAHAATVTDQYEPSNYTAEAIGATSDGWIDQTGPTWDDTSSVHNHRDTENRQNIIAAHHRDGIDALYTAIAPPTSTIKILCVGDSITEGAGSTSPGGTYNQYYLGTGQGYKPWLTSNLTRRRIRTDLSQIAEGGHTLRDQSPRVLAALPTLKPDLVLIHLGTNDIGTDTADWQNRYGQLIDGILASSPTVKIACALLPHYRNPYLDSGTVSINQWVTAAVQERSGTNRVVLSDMRALSTHWTADGTHPLEAGYVHMASIWTAAIAPWLP